MHIDGYTEVGVLGEGAGGRVTLARHDATGMPVVLKQLAPALAADPGDLWLFREEARLLANLSHPHLLRLYEYVEVAGAAVTVSQLVEGVSLRTLLAEAGTTGPEGALLVLQTCLLGLEWAHRSGLVHRDYHPGNVLVDRRGDALLCGFGIAVPAGEPAWHAGTAPYLAPEAWRGDHASPLTDMYAATAVLFECLVGRPPYVAEGPVELAAMHLHAALPEAFVPAQIRGLLRRGLAKDPAERFASAEEYLDAVQVVARTGYGPDWEDRGGRALTGAVSTLVDLWPLAVAARAPISPPDSPRGLRAGLGDLAPVAGAVLASLALIGGVGGAVAAGMGPFSRAGSVVDAGGPTVAGTLGGAPATSPPVGGPTAEVQPLSTVRPSATPRPTPRPSARATPRPAALVTAAAVQVSGCSASGTDMRCDWSANFTLSGTAGGSYTWTVDAQVSQCDTATSPSVHFGGGTTSVAAGQSSFAVNGSHTFTGTGQWPSDLVDSTATATATPAAATAQAGSAAFRGSGCVAPSPT